MFDAIKLMRLKIGSFASYNFMLFCNLIVLLCFGFDVIQTSFAFHSVLLLPPYLITAISAYLLNDFFDRDKDLQAAKANITSLIKPYYILATALLLFTVSIVYAYYLLPLISYVLGLQFFTLLLYSLPVIRLKERGFAGVIADSFYAHVIPLLILLIMLNNEIYADNKSCILLIVFSTFIGIRDILLHQLKDKDRDILSETQTFTISKPNIAKSLIKYTEYGASGLICVIAFKFFYTSGFETAFAFLAILLVVSYIVAYFFNTTNTKAGNDILGRVYIICSSFCLLFLSLKHGKYWFIILLMHPYFVSFILQLFNKAWVLIKFVFKIWLGTLLIKHIPLLINRILYRIFLVFGRDLKKRELYKRENELRMLKWLRTVFQ